MKDNQKVIQSFIKEVQEVFGKALYQIILYGSYARGDYRDNSDIDYDINVTGRKCKYAWSADQSGETCYLNKKGFYL